MKGVGFPECDLVTYNTAGTQAITSDYIASGPTARCVFTPPFWTLSLGRLGTSCRLTSGQLRGLAGQIEQLGKDGPHTCVMRTNVLYIDVK